MCHFECMVQNHVSGLDITFFGGNQQDPTAIPTLSVGSLIDGFAASSFDWNI